MFSETLLCNKLSIEQERSNGFLSGPYAVQFDILNNLTFSVFQCGNRTIELSSNYDISFDDMYDEFQSIEKLLMLFDGVFYPIKNISFKREAESNLRDCSKEIQDKRLNYFCSKDFCMYTFMKLLEFHTVLDNKIYAKWKILLEQMDISYQAFLYALSDNKNPVDMNLAFIVELAEPFVELIKENTFYCQTLTPGERGITLRMCLDSIITHYGREIFSKELSTSYSDFLDTAVGSRVRIMHIKKNQKKYWSGKECVRYSMKFSLLYRRILLELLGIKYSTYKDALKNAIDIIDNW